MMKEQPLMDHRALQRRRHHTPDEGTIVCVPSIHHAQRRPHRRHPHHREPQLRGDVQHDPQRRDPLRRRPQHRVQIRPAERIRHHDGVRGQTGHEVTGLGTVEEGDFLPQRVFLSETKKQADAFSFTPISNETHHGMMGLPLQIWRDGKTRENIRVARARMRIHVIDPLPKTRDNCLKNVLFDYCTPRASASNPSATASPPVLLPAETNTTAQTPRCRR